MERKIVLVTTTNCPRCGYINEKIFHPIADACPEQAFTINGSLVPGFPKKYGIKGAPSILFLEDEEKVGLVYQTFEIEKIIRWLKGERYGD